MDIEYYLSLYKNLSPKGYDEMLELEEIGEKLIDDFEKNWSLSLNFINRVEFWKAMGIKERIFGINVNTADLAQSSIRNAISKDNQLEKLKSFHSLRGFGRSVHKEYRTNPAKVASAAMRFLFPEQWGIVDWRSGTVANSLMDNGFDVVKSKSQLLGKSSSSCRKDFSHVDSEWAVNINSQYSKIGKHWGLDKTSEVDQVAFAISLEIWPIMKAPWVSFDCCNSSPSDS